MFGQNPSLVAGNVQRKTKGSDLLGFNILQKHELGPAMMFLRPKKGGTPGLPTGKAWCPTGGAAACLRALVKVNQRNVSKIESIHVIPVCHSAYYYWYIVFRLVLLDCHICFVQQQDGLYVVVIYSHPTKFRILAGKNLIDLHAKWRKRAKVKSSISLISSPWPKRRWRNTQERLATFNHLQTPTNELGRGSQIAPSISATCSLHKPKNLISTAVAPLRCQLLGQTAQVKTVQFHPPHFGCDKLSKPGHCQYHQVTTDKVLFESASATGGGHPVVRKNSEPVNRLNEPVVFTQIFVFLSFGWFWWFCMVLFPCFFLKNSLSSFNKSLGQRTSAFYDGTRWACDAEWRVAQCGLGTQKSEMEKNGRQDDHL